MTIPFLTRIIAVDAAHAGVDDALELPYAERQRSRQRVDLASGRAAGVNLPRGSVLRDGMLLAGDGLRVRVTAAAETVSIVRGNAAGLLRAAYHLGNRHVALQFGDRWIAYLHDHVLDDMVRGLSLDVTVTVQAFEPEPGAYKAGAHHHAHRHSPRTERGHG